MECNIRLTTCSLNTTAVPRRHQKTTSIQLSTAERTTSTHRAVRAPDNIWEWISRCLPAQISAVPPRVRWFNSHELKAREEISAYTSSSALVFLARGSFFLPTAIS